MRGVNVPTLSRSPVKTPFARALCAAQVKAGLSNRELAQRVNVSDSQLGKWKRGDVAPNLDNAVGLASALGVSVEDLAEPDEVLA